MWPGCGQRAFWPRAWSGQPAVLISINVKSSTLLDHICSSICSPSATENSWLMNPAITFPVAFRAWGSEATHWASSLPCHMGSDSLPLLGACPEVGTRGYFIGGNLPFMIYTQKSKEGSSLLSKYHCRAVLGHCLDYPPVYKVALPVPGSQRLQGLRGADECQWSGSGPILGL